jgi:hypothetical protein
MHGRICRCHEAKKGKIDDIAQSEEFWHDLTSAFGVPSKVFLAGNKGVQPLQFV